MTDYKRVEYDNKPVLVARADTQATATQQSTSTLQQEASKLVTPRAIQTNLQSSSAQNFDGSANITPGVTGVLPIQNGGTGGTSLKTVGGQSIVGTGDIPVGGGGGGIEKETLTGTPAQKGTQLYNLLVQKDDYTQSNWIMLTSNGFTSSYTRMRFIGTFEEVSNFTYSIYGFGTIFSSSTPTQISRIDVTSGTGLVAYPMSGSSVTQNMNGSIYLTFL